RYRQHAGAHHGAESPDPRRRRSTRGSGAGDGGAFRGTLGHGAGRGASVRDAHAGPARLPEHAVPRTPRAHPGFDRAVRGTTRRHATSAIRCIEADEFQPGPYGGVDHLMNGMKDARANPLNAWRTLARLRRFVLPHWPAVAWAILLMMVEAAMDL